MECALCTDNYQYYGLPRCGHTTICSLCWYRMRSILDNKTCPLCRQTSDYLFVTKSELSYENLIKTSWNDSIKGFSLDLQSHIYFEDTTEQERLVKFKQMICNICNLESKSFNQFKDHIFRFHSKRICEVCSKNNNLFPSEQELYEENKLSIHKLNHHIQCELCFDYYYDQRKLLEHIKLQHFFCELCEVLNRTAYRTYEDLETHYRQTHYLCEVGICRAEMHVVFLCYDDLKDHYRIEHPGLAIPTPVLAFKTRDDEEKPVMIFEDVSFKNYSVPQINEENKDFEFPALGGSVPEKKNVIDYSKIAPKKNSVFSPSTFPATPETRKNKKKQKTETSLLEKNIARLNNSHATVEEFLSQITESDRENIQKTISLIRSQVLSNTLKEKIVQDLEKPFSAKPEEKNKKIPEEKKGKTEEKKGKNQEKSFQSIQESFPALGNARAPKAKSEFDTLLENIAIYNNKLISAKSFVESLLEFMPRSEASLYRNTIKDKVKQEARNEVLNLLDRRLLMYSNENEYPSLVPAKPVYKKTNIEILKENLKILTEGMMTSKEFITSAVDLLQKEEVQEAAKVIKARIMNSSQANKICKDILDHFQIGNYDEDFPTLKMIKIPAEPKRKNK